MTYTISFIDRHDGFHLLAMQPMTNRIVGRVEFTRYHNGLTNLVHDVFTHDQHRRQGVATALMKDLIKRATEQGLEDLNLTVTAGNVEAQELYTKLGFVKDASTTARRYKTATLVKMRLDLTDTGDTTHVTRSDSNVTATPVL